MELVWFFHRVLNCAWEECSEPGAEAADPSSERSHGLCYCCSAAANNTIYCPNFCCVNRVLAV